jgi:hypothetical protein
VLRILRPTVGRIIRHARQKILAVVQPGEDQIDIHLEANSMLDLSVQGNQTPVLNNVALPDRAAGRTGPAGRVNGTPRHRAPLGQARQRWGQISWPTAWLACR